MQLRRFPWSNHQPFFPKNWLQCPEHSPGIHPFITATGTQSSPLHPTLHANGPCPQGVRRGSRAPNERSSQLPNTRHIRSRYHKLAWQVNEAFKTNNNMLALKVSSSIWRASHHSPQAPAFISLRLTWLKTALTDSEGGKQSDLPFVFLQHLPPPVAQVLSSL